MATATDRIVVQVTPRQKQRILKQASEAGLNISEFMRQAAEEYRHELANPALEELLDRIKQIAQESIVMMEETRRFVDESNQRIAQMEAEARKR